MTLIRVGRIEQLTQERDPRKLPEEGFGELTALGHALDRIFEPGPMWQRMERERLKKEVDRALDALAVARDLLYEHCRMYDQEGRPKK